jgi:ribosomal protein S18 acetylase RimI-like enzyme
MSDTKLIIKPYSSEYQEAVVELWCKCNLTRPWNNAKTDIQRKLQVNPDLFLLGFVDNKIIATAMGGYEGHRGWINYLAVDLNYQEKGIGKQIVSAIEQRLIALGCPKINVQIRTDNQEAIKFYESIGYKVDEVTSMGKRLIAD